jgi:hypothetical protein
MEEPEENFASRAERGEGGIFMALLKRKVQNACEKQPHGNELEFSLKNIVRNGEKVGCSGFVRNKETGLIVYLNTEDPMPGFPYLYRFADSLTDYRGCRNRFTKTTKVDELAERVVALSTNAEEYERDFRV